MHHATNTPAAVAPIKRQIRTCDELGICQGHATPCANCQIHDEGLDRAALEDIPAEPWERIAFWVAVGIASVSSVVIVCGTAGWAYAQFAV